jgi:hypothetical protein
MVAVSNDINPNKVVHRTACASAVLKWFGVEGITWNQRTKRNVWRDTLRRNGFGVRSRKSKIGKAKTVGAARDALVKIAESEPNIIAFAVTVDAHVLLVGRNGKTIVDTDARKRDRRKLVTVDAIVNGL